MFGQSTFCRARSCSRGSCAERASFLGLGCLLADPTPKATGYWAKLGFAYRGGKIWAKRS